ncbi:peroxidase 59-like [Quercus lobata]|uniref:Peroxidase n=1 Tax=Quercus lobata TaxID=97700 RepID=A0A7N2KLK1_QUELO|nr:peroxidase 59-like [Quercus lobata]
MTMSNSFYGYSLIVTFFMQLLHAWSQLTPNFYDKTCPNLQNIVRNEVQKAFNEENRMAASLLRLHFHDCFVNGCDGSVLLDVSGGEKFALSNLNSVRGFEVVDRIKSTVESACPGVVSCADILALVARDSVVISRGKSWTVLLGRRDGNVSISINGTDAALPSAFDTLDAIISKFKRVGLDEKDVVSLSGSHTIGLARCAAFSNRLFNYSGTGLPDRSMDRNLLSQLQKLCKDGDQNQTTLLDQYPGGGYVNIFGNNYFQNLLNGKSVLSSDQALLSSSKTSYWVKIYNDDNDRFLNDFADAMIRMGNISPSSGSYGQIRKNCSRVNR